MMNRKSKILDYLIHLIDVFKEITFPTKDALVNKNIGISR